MYVCRVYIFPEYTSHWASYANIYGELTFMLTQQKSSVPTSPKETYVRPINSHHNALPFAPHGLSTRKHDFGEDVVNIVNLN